MSCRPRPAPPLLSSQPPVGRSLRHLGGFCHPLWLMSILNMEKMLWGGGLMEPNNLPLTGSQTWASTQVLNVVSVCFLLGATWQSWTNQTHTQASVHRAISGSVDCQTLHNFFSENISTHISKSSLDTSPLSTICMHGRIFTYTRQVHTHTHAHTHRRTHNSGIQLPWASQSSHWQSA